MPVIKITYFQPKIIEPTTHYNIFYLLVFSVSVGWLSIKRYIVQFQIHSVGLTLSQQQRTIHEGVIVVMSNLN